MSPKNTIFNDSEGTRMSISSIIFKFPKTTGNMKSLSLRKGEKVRAITFLIYKYTLKT